MPQSTGRRIMEIRKKRKMTQIDVATKAKVTQGALSEIERGERAPSLETLVSIANALDTVPSELMGEKTCPVCGFEYTFYEGLNSVAHQEQHTKAERIVKRYGFYWPYQQRQHEMNKSYAVLADPSATQQTKYDAAVTILRALFSRSVFAYGYGDHPPFEVYVRMMLANGPEYFVGLPKSVYYMLVERYGTAENAQTGSYYQRGAAIGDMYETKEQHIVELASRISALPQQYVNIIEYIIKQAEGEGN